MGNPKVKTLKFIEINNQLVQVNESTLHLLLRPLSLGTVPVHLVHSDQYTTTPFQFLNDLQDQVRPLFHGFLKRLPFPHSLLKVNPFPVVTQSLQLLVDLVQDRLITARDRHRSRPVVILRVTNDASPLLYVLSFHQSRTTSSMTSSQEGGYTPIPPPRDQTRDPFRSI